MYVTPFLENLFTRGHGKAHCVGDDGEAKPVPATILRSPGEIALRMEVGLVSMLESLRNI
jgi:hypothetical protein